MKKYLSIFLLLSVVYTVKAQAPDSLKKLSLGIVLPEISEEFTVGQRSLLRTKIEEIITASPLAEVDDSSSLVFEAEVRLYDTAVYHYKPRDMFVVTGTRSFIIKERDSNVIFMAITKKFKGVGSDEDSALVDAIVDIRSNDSDYAMLIALAKAKIEESKHENASM